MLNPGRAETITIFLEEGEPNGLKTATLSDWVGKAIVIPRNKLKDVKERIECKKPAVYFLVGKEEEELLSSVYIGEAENLWERLSTHFSEKGFWWHTAIAFIRQDNNLTKAHVRYLESKCLSLARKAKRFNLKNSKESFLPSLPESDIASMERFLVNLEILLSALGYSILQEIISREQQSIVDPIFICQGKGAMATGRMTNEGFVVYKDSTASINISKAVKNRVSRMIQKLATNNYLKDKGNFYTFIKDYVFNSPSSASDLILGNSTSGWKMWKTKEGETLEDIYRS